MHTTTIFFLAFFQYPTAKLACLPSASETYGGGTHKNLLNFYDVLSQTTSKKGPPDTDVNERHSTVQKDYTNSNHTKEQRELLLKTAIHAGSSKLLCKERKGD
ncbi:hypothetical protein KSX_04120 [Ktedonospora formicarum]|uniref:Uncharacterized protein n=1 Tax=Ktedonospora formicarum TaxID=2778364 RepID=A0A8J3HZR0_9CHLR|nr:hypothetical protein KSX_04120 [Ktedonospora formicarum]